MSLTVISEQEVAIKAISNLKAQGPNSHGIFSSSSSGNTQNYCKIFYKKASSVVMPVLMTSGNSCYLCFVLFFFQKTAILLSLPNTDNKMLAYLLLTKLCFPYWQKRSIHIVKRVHYRASEKLLKSIMDDCKVVVPSPKRSTLWVSTIILRIIMSFLKSYRNKIRGTLKKNYAT